jgi:hypothetical protein
MPNPTQRPLVVFHFALFLFSTLLMSAVTPSLHQLYLGTYDLESGARDVDTEGPPALAHAEADDAPDRTITNVVVDKKTFKGTSARVTLRDIHIKVDNCVGASSLRSYVVLTSSSGDNDDIVAYYGVAKVF